MFADRKLGPVGAGSCAEEMKAWPSESVVDSAGPECIPVGVRSSGDGWGELGGTPGRGGGGEPMSPWELGPSPGGELGAPAFLMR
ncbi:hypothetical protein A5780_16815 [Nocardia sp. 852002-20019_SCH5090214]|nr:hypothetical protein A5789_24130 [Nocardia sp. 852002-51101_SCH5132738]OBA63685.1 hypothetical protein A5780_16815 [Nocardia sp. 852002-20019_SCH5090214]OBB29574.1 hypothetical protein A5748_09920 [Nocardia sp. 852002-51244_SCH5132740]OBF66063.1 hypothetical protein A9X06_06985 [Mycobacterium sp. 852002-51759_SCH5129042]